MRTGKGRKFRPTAEGMLSNRMISLTLIVFMTLSAKAVIPGGEEARADDGATEVRCIGICVDEAGRSLAGIEVTLYDEVSDGLAGNFELVPLQSQRTDDHGAFRFETPRRPPRGRSFGGCVVATRPGRALGWDVWDRNSDAQVTLTLGEPSELTGIVLDEAGAPVVEAEVRANLLRTRTTRTGEEERFWIPGIAPLNALGARTDAQGRFRLGGLPAGEQTRLLVMASGKATTYVQEEINISPGRNETKVLLAEDARIEGRIVHPDTGQGIPAARLAIGPTFSSLMYYRAICVCDAQGVFRLGGLQTGRYLLWGEGLPHTYVELQSGKTRQITVKACRAWYGRMLHDDGTPVGQRETWPGARVEVSLRLAGGKTTHWNIGSIDAEGVIKVYLSDEQMQQVRSGEADVFVTFPIGLRLGQQHVHTRPFPDHLLSQDRSKAGTLTLQPMWYEPPSFVGRQLASLGRLNHSLETTLGTGRLLLCFFDLNQRPSRRCLAQLTERSQQLQAAGFNIAAVQARDVDDSTWTQWHAEQDSCFPIVRTKCDFDTIRFTWGVRSLPWLILADRDHIVVAEGVTPSELDTIFKKQLNRE